MGFTYMDIKITNYFSKHGVAMRALVDTGAMFICLPAAIARELGFDIEEMPVKPVRIADGRWVEVPCIAPITIEFENREYTTEAVVLGTEPMVGVLALEAMDLVVDPIRQQVIGNPEHPDGPVARVGYLRVGWHPIPR